MGLYSNVVCACNRLGEDFQGVLQTKDLTSLLDLFWLAPDGALYEVISEWQCDPEEPEQCATVPRRGRVRPYRKSGVIRFTARSDSRYLEALTYFKCGELNSVLCSGPIFSCSTLPSS